MFLLADVVFVAYSTSLILYESGPISIIWTIFYGLWLIMSFVIFLKFGNNNTVAESLSRAINSLTSSYQLFLEDLNSVIFSSIIEVFIEDRIDSKNLIIYGFILSRSVLNTVGVAILDISWELRIVFGVLLFLDCSFKGVVLMYFWAYFKTIIVVCKTHQENVWS